MNPFLKLYHMLMGKGYASDEEKAKLKELAASDDAPADAEEKVDEVDGLPEEAPEGEGSGEESEEDSEDEDPETEKALKSMLSKAVSKVQKDAQKSIEKSIQASVEKALAEHKEAKEKRSGLYNSEVVEKRKDANQRARKFFNALLKNDVTALEKMQAQSKVYQKELSTDASGSPFGGYAVDDELNAEIMHLVTEYGVARREMTVHQLTKGSYTVNDLATDLTVAWADTETASLLSTQFVLGHGTLNLKRLYAIVTLTNTLIEDSEIDLFAFIAERVAEGMAEAEDTAFFAGDGTSTYGSFTGLLNNTNLNTVTMAGTTFASVDGDDLLDMIDATPAGAQKNGKFYMHRTVMSLVRRLKDSQNMPIFQAISEGGPNTIWGKPVVLVEAMPAKTDTAADTPFVLYGDLKKGAIFGYKGGMRAEKFSAGIVRNVANNADINLITSDRQAVRFIERTGYVTVIENAMTRLKTAAASA